LATDNDHDQKVGQLADVANKEFGRLAARLRRMGHDKPGKQMSALNPDTLDPTSQVLFKRWKKAEAELEREAGSPIQPSLDVEGDGDPPEDEVDNRIDLLSAGLDRLLGDTKRIEVTEGKFVELTTKRTITPEDGGESAPLKLSVVSMEEGSFVITSVVTRDHGLRGVVLLNRVVLASEWENETLKAFPKGVAWHNVAGVKLEGSGRKKYVTTGEALAVLVGDPLAAALDNEVDGEPLAAGPKVRINGDCDAYPLELATVVEPHKEGKGVYRLRIESDGEILEAKIEEDFTVLDEAGVDEGERDTAS
jgi:hypothetical protein